GAKSAVPRNTPATTTSLPLVTRTASAWSASVPPTPKAQRTAPDGSRESTNPSVSLPLPRTSPPVAGRASARPEKTPTAYASPAGSSARSSTSSAEVAPKRRAQMKLPSPLSFATNPSSAPALKRAGAPAPVPKFAVPSKPPPTYRLPAFSRTSAGTVSAPVPPNRTAQASAPVGEYFATNPAVPPRPMS